MPEPSKKPFDVRVESAVGRTADPADATRTPPMGDSQTMDDGKQVDGGEEEQLDALYRQALDGLEAVEHGVEIVADEDTASHSPAKEDSPTAVDVPSESPVAIGNLESTDGDDAQRMSPARVIEAALFVGGTELTAKKLRTLLRGNYPADFVEQTVGDLNQRYQAERRPYEIRFGEGGYRLVLKSEFDRVRNRVFGVGPKEVRLSQDALEVLSLVAYRQPIAPAEVEKIRQRPASGVLRQLVRRELISIARDPSNRKTVEYRTTDRFLQVFGLNHLDELPQADDLNFK